MAAKRLMEAGDATLDHLRESAAVRVQDTSLRSVAREIGMSPMSLKRFLQGTSPYSPTLRRLRTWYVRYAGVDRSQVKREDASAALAVLVRDLAPEARRRMADQVVDALARGYHETGKLVPGWLAELREPYASLEPGPAARPSAMGKYAHLDWSSEDHARRKQEEIDLEDGRAA